MKKVQRRRLNLFKNSVAMGAGVSLGLVPQRAVGLGLVLLGAWLLSRDQRTLGLLALFVGAVLGAGVLDPSLFLNE